MALAPFRILISNLPDTLYFIFANSTLAIRGSTVRFSIDSVSRSYVAIQNNKKHHFIHRERGKKFYSRGLDKRAFQIANSYRLLNIEFAKTDVVVDCGANTADLFLHLNDKIDAENYITFEPAPTEHRICKLNAPFARHINSGLGETPGVLDFYLKSDTADSSLVEPTSYTDVIKVKVTTLDTWLASEKLDRIKVLKLEAEGFEPEILKGAKNFLTKCEYVAIDGGYERGTQSEETFTVQTNMLTKQGFELVDVDFKWMRALFRNTVI